MSVARPPGYRGEKCVFDHIGGRRSFGHLRKDLFTYCLMMFDGHVFHYDELKIPKELQIAETKQTTMR